MSCNKAAFAALAASPASPALGRFGAVVIEREREDERVLRRGGDELEVGLVFFEVLFSFQLVRMPPLLLQTA